MNALLILDEECPGVATPTSDDKVLSSAPQVGPTMVWVSILWFAFGSDTTLSYLDATAMSQ